MHDSLDELEYFIKQQRQKLPMLLEDAANLEERYRILDHFFDQVELKSKARDASSKNSSVSPSKRKYMQKSPVKSPIKKQRKTNDENLSPMKALACSPNKQM